MFYFFIKFVSQNRVFIAIYKKVRFIFMTGLRYSPLHVTELCGEMQGNFKVGCARLITFSFQLRVSTHYMSITFTSNPQAQFSYVYLRKILHFKTI